IALVAVIVIIAVAALLRNPGASRENGAQATRPAPSDEVSQARQPRPPQRSADGAWLARRWQDARDAQTRGDTSSFPAWYFDSPTERQLNRLKNAGALIPPNMTKGQASDLIGLSEEPDEDDVEILKFFKVSTRDMSQTRARAEVASLFSDSANRQRWEGSEERRGGQEGGPR